MASAAKAARDEAKAKEAAAAAEALRKSLEEATEQAAEIDEIQEKADTDAMATGFVDAEAKQVAVKLEDEKSKAALAARALFEQLKASGNPMMMKTGASNKKPTGVPSDFSLLEQIGYGALAVVSWVLLYAPPVADAVIFGLYAA